MANPIKQSFCLPIMISADTPLAPLLAEIAAIGYSAVEIWGRGSDLEELARLAKANHLIISQMIGHHGIPSGLNDASQHDRIEAELIASIDVAAKYGIPGLICFSGERLAGQSDADAIPVVAAGLRRAAPYAERKGINLNLELLNSKVDHIGYLCDHSAWGVQVCQLVNSPRVRLLFDIYHMQIMEGDLIRNITQYIQWIGHFHTAGVPGRFDIDDTQEINYRAVCRAIRATGYDLYLAHEFKPKGDLLTALRQAYTTCSQD